MKKLNMRCEEYYSHDGRFKHDYAIKQINDTFKIGDIIRIKDSQLKYAYSIGIFLCISSNKHFINILYKNDVLPISFMNKILLNEI